MSCFAFAETLMIFVSHVQYIGCKLALCLAYLWVIGATFQISFHNTESDNTDNTVHLTGVSLRAIFTPRKCPQLTTTFNVVHPCAFIYAQKLALVWRRKLEWLLWILITWVRAESLREVQCAEGIFVGGLWIYANWTTGFFLVKWSIALGTLYCLWLRG